MAFGRGRNVLLGQAQQLHGAGPYHCQPYRQGSGHRRDQPERPRLQQQRVRNVDKDLMPVDPNAPTEENEPVRVPVPARRLSPLAIGLALLVIVALLIVLFK